jgi:hypothetical protein
MKNGKVVYRNRSNAMKTSRCEIQRHIVILGLVIGFIMCMVGCSSVKTSLPTTTLILISIDVEPNSPAHLGVNFIQQFTAIGTYSDGSTADITSHVAWASTAANVATISAYGVATGLTAGTTDITATLSGAASSAVPLTVIDLTAITISPASPANLAVGATQQFSAIGTYSDGSTVDITYESTWTSSGNGEIANISSTGLATGVADGITKIEAAWSGVNSSPVNLTVFTGP